MKVYALNAMNARRKRKEKNTAATVPIMREKSVKEETNKNGLRQRAVQHSTPELQTQTIVLMYILCWISSAWAFSSTVLLDELRRRRMHLREKRQSNKRGGGQQEPSRHAILIPATDYNEHCDN
jgi:hypothetical protein